MKFLPMLFLLTAGSMAAETVQLPLDVGTLTTTDNRVYEGVKVVGQDAVGLKITHAGGTARVAYEKLPAALAKRFPRDPDAAKKQKEEEAKAEAAHDRAVAKALADEGEENAGTLEKAPEMKGDNQAKIAAMEGYIVRLQQGIAEAQAEVEKSRLRAADLRADASYSVTTTDSKGNSRTDYRTNGSKVKKAEYHDKRAKNYEAKIAQAEALIRNTRANIDSLKHP